MLCQEPSRLKQAPEASESKQLKFKVIASQGKLSSQNMDGLRDKEFSLRLSWAQTVLYCRPLLPQNPVDIAPPEGQQPLSRPYPPEGMASTGQLSWSVHHSLQKTWVSCSFREDALKILCKFVPKWFYLSWNSKVQATRTVCNLHSTNIWKPPKKGNRGVSGFINVRVTNLSLPKWSINQRLCILQYERGEPYLYVKFIHLKSNQSSKLDNRKWYRN